jgi:hypothetical protein
LKGEIIEDSVTWQRQQLMPNFFADAALGSCTSNERVVVSCVLCILVGALCAQHCRVNISFDAPGFGLMHTSVESPLSS